MNPELEVESTSETAAPVEVTLVSATNCHFCDRAARLLADLGRTRPLRIREVDLHSDEGTAIARRLRVPFPPVVLIEGTYFGHGRISARRLTRALAEIDAHARVASTPPDKER